MPNQVLAKTTTTLAAATTLAISAVPAASHETYTRTATVTYVITVSCFRGPWEGVIWDRPNPVFIDSLVTAGYSYPEAHAISERVCRDQGGVGSPATLRAAMENILRTSPPAR